MGEETRMSQHQISTHTPVNRELDMPLHGPVLVLARLGWVVIVMLALGLFAASLPVRFHQLVMLSAQAEPALRHCSLSAVCVPLQVALAVNVYPVYVLILEVLLVVGLSLVGLILFWRKSDHWTAMFFSIAMITYGPYITGSLEALLTASPQWRVPISVVQMLGIGCAVLSGYLFPNGRFTPGVTRLLTLIWITWILAWLLFPSLPLNFSNPYMVSFPSFLVLMGWLCTTLLAQAYRFRHTSNLFQRQQTRWVLICMTNTIVTYVLFVLPRELFPPLVQHGIPSLLYTLIGYPLFLLSLPLSPVIIFFSILRYHLFDIDTIVNRVLVYGTLTACLALVYVSLVIGLQSLVRLFIGQLAQSPFIIVVSTLAIAALFQPLRSRLQAIIDRRFYRRKYDAAKTVEAFSATLRNEVDLNQLREHLVAVVEETMQPTFVSLWLCPTQHDGERSAWGAHALSSRHTEEPVNE
jgi:hypothetical protein